MTTFFIDLWHDLREKRLWPVAVGLLAAIVAVPAILFKPASDAAPPSPVAPKTVGPATLPVVSVDSGPSEGSRLEAYSQKNPFKPMKDLAKATPAAGAAGSGSSSTGGSSSTTGSPSSSKTSSSSKGSSSGGSPSSGGSSPSGGTSPGGTSPSTPTTTWFHYTANFSFGPTGGKAKTYKNTASFTLLPNETTPVVVFLGIDGNNKSAMFFVSDPGVEAAGEGACNADGAACRFVTLKLSESSNEESFTATDGSASYDLKLLKINREQLGSGSTPSAPASGAKGKPFAAMGAGISAATQTTQSVLPDVFATGPGVARVQK